MAIAAAQRMNAQILFDFIVQKIENVLSIQMFSSRGQFLFFLSLHATWEPNHTLPWDSHAAREYETIRLGSFKNIIWKGEGKNKTTVSKVTVKRWNQI